MNGINEFMRNKKVPFCLHESFVVAYAVTKETIRFRFAVPCYVIESLEGNSDDDFCLVDFVAYNPRLIDYQLSFLASLLPEVISFECVENEYSVTIEINGEDFNRIVFDAQKTQWIALKIITSKDLDNIGDCDFRYIQYP